MLVVLPVPGGPCMEGSHDHHICRRSITYSNDDVRDIAFPGEHLTIRNTKNSNTSEYHKLRGTLLWFLLNCKCFTNS